MTSRMHRPSERLPRTLGLFSCIALVVGVVMGSGIFRVPSPVASAAGNLSGITIVWSLGGILTLFGALAVAELAAMYPATGGPYVYLREAYGRPLGFLYGWMELLTGPIGSAAKALIFTGYLSAVVPMPAIAQHLVAAGMIIAVGAANYRSIRLAALIQNLSTGAKVIVLLLVSLAIFVLAPGRVANPLAIEPMGQPQWLGIGTALVTVMFAYEGWQGVTMVAGEVKNPQRSLPLALIGGLAIVMLTYVAINAAYLRALPLPELIGSASVASAAAQAVLGQAGASVVGALVMLSVFGTLNGGIMAGPRVFAAMADDGLFFRAVGRVHPRYKTPYVAIALSVTLAVTYVLMRDFSQLVQAYILAKWPFNALCVLGVFVLRRRRPDVPRAYRTLGYPVVPALFVLATIVVIGSTFYSHFWPTLTSVLITLLGLPVYFAWIHWQRRYVPAD